MTYQTLRCPHCRNIVERATGSPSYIGNPFRQCPWCGKFYVHAFTQEWVTKSAFGRIMFLISKPLAGAFLSLILISGLLFMTGIDIIVCLIISPILAALICIFWIFARKPAIDEMAKESLKRTQSAAYVELLKKAGFKIHHIKGADIGTQQEQNSPMQEENIEKEDKTTFDLH